MSVVHHDFARRPAPRERSELEHTRMIERIAVIAGLAFGVPIGLLLGIVLALWVYVP